MSKDNEPLTALEEAMAATREMYLALISAGFTESEAIRFVAHVFVASASGASDG